MTQAEKNMNEHAPLKHGEFSVKRHIDAPRERVYSAWTALEHRKHWFVGPAGWKQLERSVDLKVGGKEIAHGRMENGIETIYTARFHLIVPNTRLIYAFDMHVAGKHFSVSLAGVEFEDSSTGTELTYTEQAFYLDKDYGMEGRVEGTNGLLDRFEAYLSSIR